MAKNAQGSWVGKTAKPVFKTYQTAGQLQPATPPAVAPSTPTPGPIVPTGPVQIPTEFDFGGGVAQFQPVPSEFAQPEAAIDDDPRARLARAIIGGGYRGGGGSIPGRF